MFIKGDQVQVTATTPAYPLITGKIGTITHASEPNYLVTVPMYDVTIDSAVYILYHDEVTLVEKEETHV